MEQQGGMINHWHYLGSLDMGGMGQKKTSQGPGNRVFFFFFCIVCVYQTKQYPLVN